MRKIYIIIIILLLSSVYAFAQKGYNPVKDKSLFIQSYQKACGSIANLQCKFDQTKEITLLKDKLKSNGKMFFRNDNKLKIEYVKPSLFIFVLNNDKITMKDGQNAASSISLKSNKLFQQISQITMNAIDGNLFDAKKFNFSIFESDNDYLVRAVPTSKELKQYYRELDLHINKTSWLMQSIVMKEASGDITTMVFNEIDTKSKLNDEVFTIR